MPKIIPVTRLGAMSKTILVVDDDKLIREGLTVMLRAENYTVLEAENGKQGLELALAEKPALILTDFRMPEMDGAAMLSALRSDEWGATVPVFVLSNDDTTNSINAALQSGVTQYLDKLTLDHDALRQQIISILGE